VGIDSRRPTCSGSNVDQTVETARYGVEHLKLITTKLSVQSDHQMYNEDLISVHAYMHRRPRPRVRAEIKLLLRKSGGLVV
jgi:hypothetical protein